MEKFHNNLMRLGDCAALSMSSLFVHPVRHGSIAGSSIVVGINYCILL